LKILALPSAKIHRTVRKRTQLRSLPAGMRTFKLISLPVTGFRRFLSPSTGAKLFASKYHMSRFYSPLLPLLFLATGALAQQPRSSSALPSSPGAQSVVRSAYGEKLRLTGLPNGGRVNEFLYRGAQPHIEGLPELKKLGITTIVDLRGEDSGRRESEKEQAEALGIQFVSIPVSGWSPPSNEQVAQFLSLFHNNPKEKIFVHCRFGDDRTGVFVATYRMAYEGWPAQQAMNEMYFFGFNGFWHPSMKAFIRDFPSRLKTAPALAQYRPAEPPVTKCDKAVSPSSCSD
jgi:tyrosine-protein phosphatase SIW14